MLADVEERLQKLEDIYDQSVSEKIKLELTIERTQSRLNRSDLLVAALSDEQQRWENSLKVFFPCIFACFLTNIFNLCRRILNVC